MDALPDIIDTQLLIRQAVTLGVLALTVLLILAVRQALRTYIRVRQMQELRGRFVYRMAKAFLWVVAAVTVAAVWGLSVENMWVVVTGIAGVVAVGFFAVWSLLSNVVAALFIFLSDPFRIGDGLQVLGEEGVEGTVVDLKPLFVVLRDEAGNMIYIPNTMLFQKSYRRKREAIV